MTTTYWCERAWTGAGEIVTGLVVRVQGGKITDTSLSPVAPQGANSLPGLTIPGFANCHSHAFHRALRGRTQRERGTFWTWRESMYEVAGRLTPDTYYTLARATYEEMLLAGITAVGEFHYVHHDDDGGSYADRNAMGAALIAAADDAGIRIALLDTCYLSSGFGRPPTGVQVRFSDRTVDRWLDRIADLPALGRSGVVIGAALHSVRAVPYDALVAIAGAELDGPLHIHLSEQVAENEECMSIHGCTPTELLARTGILGPQLSAVHATHLSDHDIELLGSARTFACFCPTTERDLADGVGPARKLVEAGCELTLGSDSHAVIDPFEEMRAIELNERLVSQRRGHWTAAELMRVGGRAGHRSLGFGDAGAIQPGQWADLITIDCSTVRTAGTGSALETVSFAAAPADITSIIASGRVVDADPVDVGIHLDQAISKVVS